MVVGWPGLCKATGEPKHGWMDEETERRSRGCAGGVGSTAGPMLSPLFVMRSGTMIQNRVSLSLSVVYIYLYVYVYKYIYIYAQYPRREIYPSFFSFFPFQGPWMKREREREPPHFANKAFPDLRALWIDTGSSGRIGGIMIETVAVIRFRIYGWLTDCRGSTSFCVMSFSFLPLPAPSFTIAPLHFPPDAFFRDCDWFDLWSVKWGGSSAFHSLLA